MARPNKFNLDYFPLDVAIWDDHKMVMIEEKLNIKGGYIALRIMASVYASENGYFMDWPEKFEFTCAKRVGNGVTGALVWEVLQLALECGLFNRQMFEQYRIVTSSGIQKRWCKVMRDMRRKFRINPDYLLVSSEETGVSSEETTTPATFSTQKEIKGNEIKGNDISVPADAAPTEISNSVSIPIKSEDEPGKKNAAPRRREPFKKPSLQEIRDYFTQKIGDPADPRSWPEDKIRNESSGFLNYYEKCGWKVGKSLKPMVSWHAAIREWISKELEEMSNKAQASAPPVKSPAPRPATPSLSPMQRDINFLYEKFLEEECTINSVESSYYNYMKEKSMISFTEEQIADIRNRANNYIQEKNLTPDENMIRTIMKKEGVLEFFKLNQADGRKTIFEL